MKEQTHQDRRSFLKAMTGTTAVLAAVPVILKPTPAAAAETRSFSAGKYAIELDGALAGWLLSVEGGRATGEVVVEEVGTDLVERKHIGGVKYEDITVTCGPGMSGRFYQWIQDSFDRKASGKDGAIIAADFHSKEVGRLSFFNALVTEIGLPALDAASKDAAKMTLKFAPEYTRSESPSGATVPAGTSAQKHWLPSNFKIEIAGLDCSRVSKIEALTVKQKVVESEIGDDRIPVRVPRET